MWESAHHQLLVTCEDRNNSPKNCRFLQFSGGITVAIAAAGGGNPMASDRDVQITRRTFCNRALLTSAGVMLAANEIKSQQTGQGENLAVYPPAKIEGAAQLIAGSFLYFDYPKSGDAAVLVRTFEGQYRAFSRKCAHLGCSVDYDKQRRCLVCPCHRGVYDARNGYVMYGPPPRPLDQIILQMRAGGEVWAVGKRLGGDPNV
jgi:arsenite oxidase small subunit